jgi:hypothetical protein
VPRLSGFDGLKGEAVSVPRPTLIEMGGRHQAGTVGQIDANAL